MDVCGPEGMEEERGTVGMWPSSALSHLLPPIAGHLCLPQTAPTPQAEPAETTRGGRGAQQPFPSLPSTWADILVCSLPPSPSLLEHNHLLSPLAFLYFWFLRITCPPLDSGLSMAGFSVYMTASSHRPRALMVDPIIYVFLQVETEMQRAYGVCLQLHGC